MDWHALTPKEALEKLRVDQNGLSFKEVRKRKRLFGRNQLKQKPPRSAWLRFFDQFNNVLIYVLLLSSVITFSLQKWIDAAVILIVVILNAIIGFIQESKAEKALDSIRQLLSSNATVIRHGRQLIISSKSLVPGDIVLLQSGDKVPADIKLIETRSLRLQEAALTGESTSVEKSIEPDAETAALPDRHSIAYSSTIVTYGRGKGVVVATGNKTEIGRISRLIETIIQVKTPLLQQFDRFGRWLTAAILFISVATFLAGVFIWHESFQSMFLAMVGIAVAAIPEGLPAIMTITLAIGVTRMAKRNAIIRHLPTVETMGSVSVICTDKTGTLTHNEMTVQQIALAEEQLQVTGSGYNATGAIHRNDELIMVNAEPLLQKLIIAGMLCNDAQLTPTKKEWELQGNAVDGSLLSLALKAKLDLKLVGQQQPRTDFIPFESEHKLMASLHHDHTGRGFIYVKGAPERILARCRYEATKEEIRELNRDFWLQEIERMASAGLRIVAIAMRETDADQRTLQFADIDDYLILLGFVGLIDPPRDEAIFAVAQCQSAGINVKMITGDHALTARTVAEQVGLVKKEAKVLTGEAIDGFDDDTLLKEVESVNIYARTSPEHKLRLVQALQKHRHVVAMTGDGVNDAPALKQAEVGIAMGMKGTEAAKEVSQIVLADDNFVSIYHAVLEGRTVYDNLKKAILYVLPTSFGEGGIIALAILLGFMMPITPVQILWVNLITAVTLSISLGFEKPESNVMRRPPRKRDAPILSKLLIWRLFFVTALMFAFGFGLFLFERLHGVKIAEARTIVVNMLVMSEVVYLFNCRKMYESAFQWETFFGSRAVLIAVGLVVIFQLAFTYLPGMDRFFGVVPISLAAWGKIAILSALLFVLVELEKLIVRKI